MNKNNIEWFKKFVDICEKHKLWYSVFYGTLIGAIRENGPIEWDDDFDVIMTPQSYEKLKKLYPVHCLDADSYNKYPLVFPKFVPDVNDIFSNNIFVDIFLIVNSSEDRIKEFYSKKTRLKYTVQTLRIKRSENKSVFWLIRFIAFFLQYFIPKFTTTKALNILQNSNESKSISYVLNSPYVPLDGVVYKYNINKTTKQKFLDFHVNVPKNYDDILRQRFNDYMIPVKEVKSHTSVLSTN